MEGERESCVNSTQITKLNVSFSSLVVRKNARSVIVPVTQVDEIRPFLDYTLFDLVS